MKRFSVLAVASIWLGVATLEETAFAITINEAITPLGVNSGGAFTGDGSWNPTVGPATADATTGAPGWGTSSFVSNITGTGNFTYSEFQVNLNTLFGRTLTINDLSSISYNTKNNESPNSTQDWDIRLYTAKPVGTGGSYYLNRFETANPVAGDNNWHTWSTETNSPFINVQSGFGVDTPLNSSLTGLHTTYGTEPILYLSFIAGASGNNLPIANNLDGIQITLADGSVANINLGATPEPGSFALFGLGAIGLFIAARRRRRTV